MDFESILNAIQPFVIMFAALLGATITAVWIAVVIWTFRDIRARTRDVFAQILATLLVLLFLPFFPLPGWILYLILRPRETLTEVYERSLEEEALLQSIEERMACPGCNRRIEETFMICPTCHTRLKKACPTCGRLLHLRWNICPYCGAVQTAAKATAALQPMAEPPRIATPTPSPLPEPMVEPEPEPMPQAEPETAVESEPLPEIEDEAEVTAQPVAEAQDTTEAEPAPEAEGEASLEPETESEPEEETLPFEFE
jgi:RNA polymerase subunit RPABC4/transcription elongation factor Spt4